METFMELAGWAPLDLVIGGILTAGVAFGVYKCGCLGFGKGPNTELNAAALSGCMAMMHRPSEMDIAALFEQDKRCKRLSKRLSQSIAENRACPSKSKSKSKTTPIPLPTLDAKDFYGPDSESEQSYQDLRLSSSSPSTSTSATEYEQDFFLDSDVKHESPPMWDESIEFPPEVRERLVDFRSILGKRVNRVMSNMEKQRRGLATELRETREALAETRKEREEEAQEASRLEAYLEERNRQREREQQQKASNDQQEQHVKHLKHRMSELEEQLDSLYRDNFVVSKAAAAENARQQQEMRDTLDKLKEEIAAKERLIAEKQELIDELHATASQLRAYKHRLAQENVRLQRKVFTASRATRRFADAVVEASGSTGDHEIVEELAAAADQPDSQMDMASILKNAFEVIRRSRDPPDEE